MLGAFIQSSIGFGLAIIAAPILFVLNPLYVPAPITLVTLVISCLNTWRYRKSVSLDGLWAAVLARIPGAALGAYLLLWIDPKSLSLWLGISVLLAVAVSLSPITLKPTTTRMSIAGFLSGFMGTSSSIGGPPLALLLQHEEANLIRANLSAFFIASSTMSLAMMVPVGYLNASHLELALPLIPAGVAGYFLATLLANRINKRRMRQISLMICLAAGSTAVISYWN